MSRISTAILIAANLFAIGCTPPPDDAAKLDSLFDESWEFQLEEFPTLATMTGDHRFDDRLASVTVEDEARRADHWRDVLERLGSIDRSQLDRCLGAAQRP